MSWVNRLRNSLPTPNYAETDTEEEDLEEGLVFDSPLTSPGRPAQSPSVSPRNLLQPDPPEGQDLEDQINKKLSDLTVDEDEEVIAGQVTGVGDSEVCADNEDQDNGIAQPVIMAAFEDINEEDDAKALSEALRNLKGLEFDQNDVKFFFNQLEIKMTSAGVKKQYTKLQVLGSAIPKNVQDQVKSYLSKSEAEYTQNNAYKLLKTRILKIYGESEEARFERALQRTLTGKPSELARTLVTDICDHEMDGCCCRRAVATLWKKNLPVAVRQAVASLKFDKDNFETVVGVADSVYASTRPTGITVAAIQSTPGPVHSWTATTPHQATTDLNQGFVADPGDPVQVAAQSIVAAVQSFGRGRGRGSGGRGGRNQGRGVSRGGRGNRGGAQNQSGGTHRWSNLKKHADGPPSSVCRKHYVFGKSAHWCEEPATCPWKDYFVPKGQ